ncbi:long-chain fatty acid--CoA ligase [Algivirga pacifica]|uniref:Long-chain fatty acid--CoA ligase n=1 Tax=Algivirga pacifica TaxID=1162670 RepID=A0ABP9DDA6_9BACT
MANAFNQSIHLAQSAQQNAEKYGERAALYYQRHGRGEWIPVSWQKFYQQIQGVGKALLKEGIKVQEMVGIFSQNMPEWSMADFGSLSVRAVPVPIYATNTAEQTEYIIHNADIRILFVGEQEQYDKALAILPQVPQIERIIVFDSSVNLMGEEKAVHFSDFIKIGENDPSLDEILQTRTKEAQMDDLVTLIYTSGTTGNPKGVMLDASNFSACMQMHDQRLHVTDQDTSLCFLPLSHIFERAWSYYMFHKGVTNYYNLDPKNIKEALTSIRPNLLCSVPRLYEKVYSTIIGKVEKATPTKKALFNWAVNVGKQVTKRKEKGKKPFGLLQLKYAVADKLVLSKLRQATGLDRNKFLPVAGSRLSTEVKEFMFAIGLNIKYGYGLSETCATVSCFQDKIFKLGTIGTPMPGVAVKLGENNEILVKGPTVMKGYYKNPEATAETFEGEWLKTGDAGDIDASGNLIFTERIKDLIKTSGGKYVAPQTVENTICRDEYVEQVAVVGDEQKYVTALIVPAFEALEEYARNAGIAFKDRLELISHADIQQLFDNRIKKIQDNLARFEQVKKFTLLPEAFTIEKGEITPTLKVRRKIILEHFANEIASMYPAI